MITYYVYYSAIYVLIKSAEHSLSDKNMRTLQHLKTKTKIFIDCYTHSQYFDTICGKYVASFCCKKCRVKRYCFFCFISLQKSRLQRKSISHNMYQNMEGVCKISMIAFNIDLTHFHFPKRQ